MSNHIWTQENLDAYLAGGLTPRERLDVEQHLAGCDECAQTLADARKMEQTMDDLFAHARPDAGLEQRAIARVRKSRMTRATAMRFLAAAAAVLVLGLVGAAVQEISGAGVISPSGNHEGAQDERKSYFGVLMHGTTTQGKDGKAKDKVAPTYTTYDGDPAGKDFDADINYNIDPTDKTSTNGFDSTPYIGLGTGTMADYQNKKKKVQSKDLSEETHKELMKLPALGGQAAAQGGSINSIVMPEPKERKEWDAKSDPKAPVEFNLPALGIREPGKQEKLDHFRKEGLSFGIEMLYDEKLRKQQEAGYDSKDALLVPRSVFVPYAGTNSDNGLLGGWTMKPGDPRAKEAAPSSELSRGYLDKLGQLKQDPTKTPPPAVGAPPKRKPAEKVGPPVDPDDDQAPDGGGKPPQEKVKPTPIDPMRKIIRTGEMEFEVDKFRAAVKAVNALLAKYPGSESQKEDSRQLENGKTRGYLVVRVPPESFDRFLEDLRTSPALGDLKTERIGSADVTKIYIDIDGELKAAKVVEKRLIEIIDKGKGDIKDLIAAERELGIWRTKIEKMIGELRYYDNQVRLCTLTINLVEKEILAATALVITDKVQMRVEVDDVRAAHESARELVKAAGGRVTKADIKQLKAGQFEGMLHAEVPPGKKKELRKAFKELGILAEDEDTQTQRTEGGGGRSTDVLKERISDVQFELTLHNLANIQPKETTNLVYATSDVPGWLAKLQTKIKDVSGQVRNAKLNEQDKLTITAEISFNVPIAQKSALDEFIKTIGAQLSRNNVQAAVTEISTERKHGYHLVLRDIANVPPRETFYIQVATRDVSETFRELKEKVAERKGLVLTGQLIEDNKINIAAKLEFDVHSADRAFFDKLLVQPQMSVVLSRTNGQVPVNETATDQKIGYRLVLVSVTKIAPREIVKLAIETKDVDKKVAEFKEMALAGKGRVSDSNVARQENGQVTAFLVLDVPLPVLDLLVRQIKEAGNLQSQTTTRNPNVQDNELATGRIEITLNGVFAGKQPRETVRMDIEVADVDDKAAELKKAARAVKGRVADEKAGRQSNGQVTATLIFEVPLAAMDVVVKQFKLVGNVLTYDTSRAPQVPDNELATARIEVKLYGVFAGKPPREIVELTVEVDDVNKTAAELKDLVRAIKGRVATGNVERQPNGQAKTVLVFNVPLSAQDGLVKQFKAAGKEIRFKTKTSTNVPENDLATAQIIVTLDGIPPIVGNDEGLSSYVRQSLNFSFKIFAYCLLAIITGLSALVPICLVIVVGYVATRWMWPGDRQVVGKDEPLAPIVVEKPTDADDKPATNA